MKWKNSGVEEDMKDEMGDLAQLMALVAQLPKQTALRMLDYAIHYVKDGYQSAPAGLDIAAEFKKFMASKATAPEKG